MYPLPEGLWARVLNAYRRGALDFPLWLEVKVLVKA
jgi:hypothetical protein